MRLLEHRIVISRIDNKIVYAGNCNPIYITIPYLCFAFVIERLN